MKIRTMITAVALASGIALASAPGASAATDITRAGSCKLSANWTVNISVNFNNTGGSPSTGEVDYVVMSSPGELSGTSDVQAYTESGDYVDTGWTGWERDFSKPGYVYRNDPTQARGGARKVVTNPRAYTGYFCSDYSQKSTVYPIN